ncbi:fimbria/pilus outer membrane usher protein [Dyella acidiphila]|uniref:Fimbrial biogenesis outer membrane usher protein n=1 Tax=Dyella acidiphila TaxID=2775866 RepID=A0ABR9GBP1_9GAMM|nr:fimbria/pilus outer membrane usher protein [Dyella acidiphila]MBE1161438.1 fimbrial biogenesis outer membrane usher protein [Dyella acidiphila]
MRIAYALAGLAMLPGAALAGGAAAASAALAAGGSAHGLDFDATFLSGGASSADLERFAQGNRVPPGDYQVDVYLNEALWGSERVHFAAVPGSDDAVPCITPELARRLGLDLTGVAPESPCLDLAAWAPAAIARFDFGEQRLDIGVPQAKLKRSARGYVDPSKWDRGITAGLLNYDLNMYRSDSGTRSDTQGYLGVAGGLNLGGWNLRHQSSLTWNSRRQGPQWQNLRNYAQHDLVRLKSQLLVGDFTTDGDLFDSMPVRGVELFSDERMLPDSQRGYAPVVRGIAATNAKVTIRQNGYTIYETTVGAGPFLINDLYPSGYGGDLEVSVLEADGRTQKFNVPYAAVPRMLRPGSTRYSAAIGEYREAVGGTARSPVLQATVQRGISNRFTGYAGLQAAEHYGALQLGGAWNTRIGAFGLDATHARTSLRAVPSPDPARLAQRARKASGQSIRISYSKALNDGGTNLSLAAYRHSTGDFYSLRDALRANQEPGSGSMHQRNTLQLVLSQKLGSGSIYLTGSTQNYWGRPGGDTQYQLGYNNATRWFNYSISAARSRNSEDRWENRIYATLSIPLGGSGSLNSSVNVGRRGIGSQVNYSNLAGDRGSYGISLARDEAAATSFNANGSYRADAAILNGSAATGNGYRQIGFGAAGSILAHAGGVTLGQNMGDTIALIKAPDAAGAHVASYPGVQLDRRGYAIVPYLVPYQRNQVELDPKGLSSEVELVQSSREVVPRSGAIVLASFETKKGRVAVIDLKPAAHVTIPFGADVLDEGGNVVGVVSQGGRAMVRGVADRGRLTVALAGGSRCSFGYQLPAKNAKARGAADYAHLQSVCDPGSKDVDATSGSGPKADAAARSKTGKARNSAVYMLPPSSGISGFSHGLPENERYWTTPRFGLTHLDAVRSKGV